jgi:hypothetical protein
MSPLDLIKSKDGSMSLTKLSASTFHFLLAVFVSINTWKNGFDINTWLVYGGYAVGHAAYDKTMATVKDFQDKKLEKAGPQ